MPMSLWASIPIEQDVFIGADFNSKGSDTQPRKAKRQVYKETTSFYWKIGKLRNLWSAKIAIKRSNKCSKQKGSEVFVFWIECRHSHWGTKTEQHLRAHKAVHLNKQGYVLFLCAQWSPSKNMVMPLWMDARTPKLLPFHFVWKNVT